MTISRESLLIVVCVTIQELQLPKSIITRLAKGVLPLNTQIQANAILAMTKSATVFINHLANAYEMLHPLYILSSRDHWHELTWLSQGQRSHDAPEQEDHHAG